MGSLKPSVLTTFDEFNPPFPIYTTAKSLRIVFQSDGSHEKLGFAAEIFQGMPRSWATDWFVCVFYLFICC
jgi:hypothetical protein